MALPGHWCKNSLQTCSNYIQRATNYMLSLSVPCTMAIFYVVDVVHKSLAFGPSEKPLFYNRYGKHEQSLSFSNDKGAYVGNFQKGVYCL